MTSPSATTRARTPPHAMAQTSGQEEAMADPRQVERLVQHVQRLPQRDEYWVGTHRLARLWVTPRTAPPYRPYLTLVLSQEGKIVRSQVQRDRKSTRLNSSHSQISYAVFCLKKKKNKK